MATIRTLIVDDERAARTRLKRLLASEADIEVAGECGDGNTAVSAIREGRPELVFLDIEMPGKDGFQVLSELGDDVPAAVIFVTAFDRYAMRAFDTHVLDYVLKPVDEERFRAALTRARTRIGDAAESLRLRNLFAAMQTPTAFEEPPESEAPSTPVAEASVAGHGKYVERLLVSADGRVAAVRTADIDWIEGAGNYVRLHINKVGRLVRLTLASLEERLDPNTFVRIHRSAIVNLDRVRELQPWFSGDFVVLLTNGEQLRLSRTYRRLFESRFL